MYLTFLTFCRTFSFFCQKWNNENGKMKGKSEKLFWENQYNMMNKYVWFHCMLLFVGCDLNHYYFTV